MLFYRFLGALLILTGCQSSFVNSRHPAQSDTLREE